MIAEAAYYRMRKPWLRRRLRIGGWLEAEAEIDRTLKPLRWGSTAGLTPLLIATTVRQPMPGGFCPQASE